MPVRQQQMQQLLKTPQQRQLLQAHLLQAAASGLPVANAPLPLLLQSLMSW
jgi:hypothetical protein